MCLKHNSKRETLIT